MVKMKVFVGFLSSLLLFSPIWDLAAQVSNPSWDPAPISPQSVFGTWINGPSVGQGAYSYETAPGNLSSNPFVISNIVPFAGGETVTYSLPNFISSDNTTEVHISIYGAAGSSVQGIVGETSSTSVNGFLVARSPDDASGNHSEDWVLNPSVLREEVSINFLLAGPQEVRIDTLSLSLPEPATVLILTSGMVAAFLTKKQKKEQTQGSLTRL